MDDSIITTSNYSPMDNVSIPSTKPLYSNMNSVLRNPSTVPNVNVSETTNTSNFWTIGKYVIVILLISFLGFNIFTALGKTTDATTNVVSRILTTLGYTTGETIKKTVKTASNVSKLGIDVAEGTVEDAVNLMEQSVGVKDVKFNRMNNSMSTDKAINSAIKNRDIRLPEPDDSTSSTQQTQKRKSGYCYIGEDRGFRSCIKVGEGDTCMSGDIFPTIDICINPNLRE
jgi:hypothetical protein